MTLLSANTACAAILGLSASLAAAQTAEVPQLGFLLDRDSHRIQRVLGVAGAAVTVPESALGSAYLPAAVSPRGKYVLVLSAEKSQPALWTPAAAEPTLLRGLHPNADAVVLSPEGSAAAFYYKDRKRIVTISGLPDAPVAVASVHVDLAAGAPEMLAVSDDGQIIMTAEGSAVTVSNNSGEVNRISISSPAAALAFAPGSHAAIIAGSDEALCISDAVSAAAQYQLPAAGLGVFSAAAFSQDGAKIILTSASLSKIALFGVGSSDPAVVLDCSFVPSGLNRIGGSLYQLNLASGTVSWMLDISGPSPRILSVPTAPDPEK